MPKRRPGISRAHEYLRRLLPAHMERLSEPLPSIDSLAAAADVSRVTMSRALRELERDSIVVIRHGKGVFVKTSAEEPRERPAVDAPRGRAPRRWEQTARTVEHDLLCGRFPADTPLPGAKSLCALYGVNYRTLRKALDLLCTKDLLETHGRSLRPRLAANRGTHNVVLVIARDPIDIGAGARTTEKLRMLESISRSMRVGLEPVLYRFGDRPPMYVGNRPNGLQFSRRERDGILGCVVLAGGLGRRALRRELPELALSLRKPIAVLDEEENPQRQISFTAGKGIAVYRPPHGRRPGYDIGRYLLTMRHRHVAYISPVHDDLWSQERLAGLRDAFEGAGDGRSVHAFTDDITGVRHAFDAHALEKAWLEQLERAASREGSGAGAIVSEMARMLAVPKALPQLLERTLREILMRMLTESLVERAAAEQSATAWVAANDGVAMCCLELLKRRRIRVPEHTSLVGFDNSIEALQHKLTSYDFDRYSLIHACLTHALSPRPERDARRRPCDIQMEGVIRVRDTVCRR